MKQVPPPPTFDLAHVPPAFSASAVSNALCIGRQELSFFNDFAPLPWMKLSSPGHRRQPLVDCQGFFFTK